MKIIWSKEAENTFQNNIEYLKNNSSEKEILNFVRQTNHIIFRIEQYPLMHMASPKSRLIRKAKINKYITLYYRYYVAKKEALLLSFWHIKQNPSKLKY